MIPHKHLRVSNFLNPKILRSFVWQCKNLWLWFSIFPSVKWSPFVPTRSLNLWRKLRELHLWKNYEFSRKKETKTITILVLTLIQQQLKISTNFSIFQSFEISAQIFPKNRSKQECFGRIFVFTKNGVHVALLLLPSDWWGYVTKTP